jgi:hypothetical protein
MLSQDTVPRVRIQKKSYGVGCSEDNLAKSVIWIATESYRKSKIGVSLTSKTESQMSAIQLLCLGSINDFGV